jgi:predicted PurR-regulated permease PerM
MNQTPKKIPIIKALVLILVLITFFYFFGDIAHVLFIFFAGILFAILLSGITHQVVTKMNISRPAALSFTIVLIIALLVASSLTVGPKIAKQFVLLFKEIPEILYDIQITMQKSETGQMLWESASDPEKLLNGEGSSVYGKVTGAFSIISNFVIDIVVVFFLGIFLSINPGLYTENFIRLFPQEKRKRLSQVLSLSGRALRWWLVGRLASMLVVGILTIIGLYIIGLPLALSLGLVATFASFVPYIGPVVSAIPAIIIGLSQSPLMAVKVIIVYFVVQSLESYIITPMIQERAVSMPPALLLAMQILMGVVVGVTGVLLATPLAVVLIIFIQMLYVEDQLGDKIDILGDHHL